MNTPVVLITGALTGIGRATALAFAREGARLVISGRSDDEVQKLTAELQKLGAEAEFLRSDVCHEDDVRNLIDKTIARFGRLDAAVNCAGTEGKPGPVTDQTAETYAATFDTNVLGTLLSMKHEMRVMLAQGGGSIVNVSSTYGHTGAAGASIYSASKHAVEGLTKSAALEVASSGVRVNMVAPGPVETGMLNRFTGTDERKASLAATVPLKRVGKPEEIAQTIVFLSSDKASFITAASYVVPGAAGATGSVAGQIAKIKGCRVVGTAGSKEKCDWLIKEEHFDAAINYKTEDIGTRLSELCAGGIDVFFDNVGGTVLNEVLARINLKARIVLCGSISRSDTSEPGPANYFNLVARRGRMEGFTGLDYGPRVPEALEALGRWQREGWLVQKEDVAVGLENAPQTLMRLFTGENFGKQLLKIADVEI